MKSGIYKILNLQDGKFYIGSAVDLDSRFYKHKFDLYNNNHHNSYLQRAFNLYGAAIFEFGVLEYCERKNLIEREQHYIDNLKPEYNSNPIAASRLGTTHNEKTKVLMSIKAKGRPGPNLGKKFSDAHRAAMSKSRKGKGKRDKLKWPHEKGARCKCEDCLKQYKAYQKLWWSKNKERYSKRNIK